MAALDWKGETEVTKQLLHFEKLQPETFPVGPTTTTSLKQRLLQLYYKWTTLTYKRRA